MRVLEQSEITRPLTPQSTQAGRVLQLGIAANVISALGFSTEGLLSVRTNELGVEGEVALFVRYLVALLLLLPWYYWRQSLQRPESEAEPQTTVTRGDLFLLVAAGILTHGIVSRLLFESFARIPTWLTVIIFFTFPAMVTIGGHLIGRERINSVRLITLLITFGGIALVAGRPGVEGATTINPLGVMLALAAALGNAIFLLLLEPVLGRVRVNTAIVVQVGGAVAFHGVLVLVGGDVLLRLVMAAPAWPWLIGLALAPTIIAVSGQNVAVQAIGSSRAATITTIQPVFVLIWGVILLGETISGRQAIGGVLVLIGILGLVLFGGRRQVIAVRHHAGGE